MNVLGVQSIAPWKKTSRSDPEHRKYPYLLRGLQIECPNHVWAADITWIIISGIHYYLVAVIDWFSRYILSWRLSDSMETGFCIEALEASLKTAKPRIFNTDQGVQFTSVAFTGVLKNHGIEISMDGKGRYQDNIIIERFWRTLKYDAIYGCEHESAAKATEEIGEYIAFYNTERPHSSLAQRTPAEVYFDPNRQIAI